MLSNYYLMNGSVFLTEKDYPNSANSLYGLLKLEAASQQLEDHIISLPNKLAPNDKNRDVEYMGDWHGYRRKELVAANADNILYEEGSMTVQGHESLRPGINLILTRGGLRASYYITAVTQEFKPYQSYDCTLQVKRGTGFIERSKMAGSPYLAEGRPGAYGR